MSLVSLSGGQTGHGWTTFLFLILTALWFHAAGMMVILISSTAPSVCPWEKRRRLSLHLWSPSGNITVFISLSTDLTSSIETWMLLPFSTHRCDAGAAWSYQGVDKWLPCFFYGCQGASIIVRVFLWFSWCCYGCQGASIIFTVFHRFSQCFYVVAKVFLWLSGFLLDCKGVSIVTRVLI